MKQYKKDRLRKLVLWGYITQQQANQIYRDYLRGVIPIVKKLPVIHFNPLSAFIALPTNGKRRMK